MMQINNEHKIKDIVYHTVSKFNEENMRGVVTQIVISGPDAIEYKVAWETQQEGLHFPAELLSREEYELNRIL